MIDRYQSFGPTMGLRQVMDRLLEDAFVLPRGGDGQGWGGPALNVYEEGDQLTVEAQLPGLKPDERLFEEVRRRVEGHVYAILADKVAAVEACLDELDADPARVRRLCGWDWINAAIATLPEPLENAA